MTACRVIDETYIRFGAVHMPQQTMYYFYRNATAKLNYAGTTFLLHPMLSSKGALPSFAGIEATHCTIDLGMAKSVATSRMAVFLKH
ncbi:hypothetical protein ROBYS_16330 [Roseobacter sp. OBYS 0001]|nr:hypothetical protein ROBYS_16330 [Roseobacter sp. OBYS 0001]